MTPWQTPKPGGRPLLPRPQADHRGDGSPDPGVTVLESIQDIEAGAWNALSLAGNPFLRHEFISALEASGSAAPETGWEPCHLVLRHGDDLLGAMPLYLKSHSWGEFVFDHAWADAFHRAGRHYYPKLVSCVPFTPVTGPRMLVAPGMDRRRACRLLIEAAGELCRSLDASSLHLLFPPDDEVEALEAADLMLRKDCQYHWHNRAYRDFDHFLAGFRSARRKKLLRERRRVSEAGIRFRTLTGAHLEDGLLETVFGMHAFTFMGRGQAPYLNLDCFRRLRDGLGEDMVMVIAERQDTAVACALSFRGADALYGRYWGAVEHHHSLHFETCFYQGIEFCIGQGLDRFEPGAQGEHKLRRGFDPTVTWSAHWIADPAFAAAIGDYLDREAEWVDRYVIDARDKLPFHRDAGRPHPEESS